jgi:hypothetical protein
MRSLLLVLALTALLATEATAAAAPCKADRYLSHRNLCTPCPEGIAKLSKLSTALAHAGCAQLGLVCKRQSTSVTVVGLFYAQYK